MIQHKVLPHQRRLHRAPAVCPDDPPDDSCHRVEGVAYDIHGVLFAAQVGRDNAARQACRAEYQAHPVEFARGVRGVTGRPYGHNCPLGDVVDVLVIIDNPPRIAMAPESNGPPGEPDKRPVCAEAFDDDWAWTRGGRGRHV